METLFQDIRYGLRMLRRNPGFTIVAALTLALGIGANTAIFSILNAVILSSLPVERPNELVVVGDPARAHSVSIGTPQADLFSYPLYRELRDHNSAFSGMAASAEVHRTRVETEAAGAVTEDAIGTLVTGNYFSLLGVKAFRGRTLASEDDAAPGAHPVVVLSYDFWKQRFSQDPAVIGQTVRLNRFPYTVIGVAVPGFFGDTVGDRQDFWVPMAMQTQIIPGRPWLENIQVSWLRVIGRLKPGMSAAQAEANLNLTFKQWIQGPQVLALDAGDQVALHRAQIHVGQGGGGFSSLRQDAVVPLAVLMAIAGLVLLIACVNVANLLLARASARQKEVAVRLAIGATRTRLVRQLMTESFVLAFAGGVAGLLAAAWGTRALLRFVPVAKDLVISPDLRVLAFTASVCVLTGLLFGLAPALRASRVPAGVTLKEGALSKGRASRFSPGKVLVALQVAVCVLVLFAAGLLLRSLRNLQNIDLGYSKEHILMVSADPVPAGYKEAQVINFQQEMIRRLSAIPGVRNVAVSQNGLFSGTESSSLIKIEGYNSANNHDREVFYDQVGQDYFRALEIPLLMGREFGPQDTPSSPRVIVIDESMARFYFRGDNPIGRKIRIDDRDHQDKPMEIVGVVRDVRDHELRGPAQRRFYIPTTQPEDALYVVNFAIRAAGKPENVMESARKAFAAFDGNVPILGERTVEELVNSKLSSDVLIARLSSFFGLLALSLACVGLYGLMSYTVGGRTKEIGLRMALGAQRQSVIRMVLGETMKLVLVGVLVGAPAALVASQLIRSILFGLKATDPISLAAVVVLLVLVALLAGLIPARRATKVDPMVALRYE